MPGLVQEKTAKTLAVGDVLLNTGAVLEAVVPSHHGSKIYLRAKFSDGYTQVCTIPADTPIAVWLGGDDQC